MQESVPDSVVGRLEKDGIATVRGLLDGAACAALNAAVRRAARTPSRFYRCLSPEGRAVVESDLFRWRDTPEIARLVCSPALTELASGYLDTDDPVVLEDQWFWSHPGSGTESPWHQDDPYHPLDRPFLTIWLPVSPVPAGLGLRGVAGSHLGPAYAPIEFSARESTISGRDDSPLPQRTSEPDASSVVAPDAEPGDAVLLDSRTLHSAGGPCPDHFIRLSIRYAHPGTVRRSRPWPVAGFWDELSWADGDRLPADSFPRVSRLRTATAGVA